MVGEVFIVIGYYRHSCWDRSHRHQGFWLYLFLIHILIQRHFPFLYLIVVFVIKYYWIPWSLIWIVNYHDTLIPFAYCDLFCRYWTVARNFSRKDKQIQGWGIMCFMLIDFIIQGKVMLPSIFFSVVVFYIVEEQALPTLVENSW